MFFDKRVVIESVASEQLGSSLSAVLLKTSRAQLPSGNISGSADRVFCRTLVRTNCGQRPDIARRTQINAYSGVAWLCSRLRADDSVSCQLGEFRACFLRLHVDFAQALT